MGKTAKRIADAVPAMRADELAGVIKEAIARLFPASFVRVRFGVISPVIHVVFAFDQKDGWPNGIAENDRAFHRIFVGNGEIANDGTLPPKLKAELLTGGSVRGPNATNSVRVGWRNRTGTPEQIVRHIAAYFSKLDDAIRSHPDADKWATRPA